LKGLRKTELPDVILVRKVYNKDRPPTGRIWKIKHLPKEVDMRTGDEDKATKDLMGFYDEIERDPETRTRINLYKVKDAESIALSKNNNMADVGDEVEDPDEVKLNELLEDLALDDEGPAFIDEDDVDIVG